MRYPMAGRRCGGRARARRRRVRQRRSVRAAARSSGFERGPDRGAGATFAAPVYQRVGARRLKNKDGLTVNYQAVGSGARHRRSSRSKTVDFGASDPPLKPDEHRRGQEAAARAVQVPTVLGAITVSYNVSGVETGLKLDGATIADIFLGKITKWNDPAIAALNSGVDLPSTDDHRRATARTPRARRRTSPTTSRSTTRVEEQGRRRQDGQVADRHRRQGQRRRRRLRQAERRRASATSSRRTRCRTTSPTAAVKNKSGDYIAPTLDVDERRRRGRHGRRPTSRFSAIDSPNPKAYPITSRRSCSSTRTCARPGQSEDDAPRTCRRSLELRARRGPGDRRRAAVRAAARPTSRRRPRSRSTACSATAAPLDGADAEDPVAWKPAAVSSSDGDAAVAAAPLAGGPAARPRRCAGR